MAKRKAARNCPNSSTPEKCIAVIGNGDGKLHARNQSGQIEQAQTVEKPTEQNINEPSLLTLRETYEDASSTVSELIRQFTLGGIAIIWVFKKGGEDSAGIQFSAEMGKALLWFLLSASFDLIQYLYKTVVFSVLFHRRWSRNADLARAANFSNKWNYATWVIWMAKVACAGIAYWLIGKGMMAQGFSFASL